MWLNVTLRSPYRGTIWPPRGPLSAYKPYNLSVSLSPELKALNSHSDQCRPQSVKLGSAAVTSLLGPLMAYLLPLPPTFSAAAFGVTQSSPCVLHH